MLKERGQQNLQTSLRLVQAATRSRNVAIFILGIVLSLPVVASPQSQADAAAEKARQAAMLATPPRTWVAQAIDRELDILHDRTSHLRYRMHMVNSKGDQVRDVIESQDGTVARLILRDGKPLTEEQDRDERERLNDMLKHPDAFAKHIKDNQSGKKIADQLMRLMPDAMIYTYVAGQPQTGRRPGITEIVIDYEPNPKFHPPSTTAEALTGLRGRAWIDMKTKTVVRMEGNIFRGVNFGWGMLAHIYPGGQLTLEQAEAADDRWIFTHFKERIAVRALMVKSLNIQADIDAWDFRPVPAMSYQDAVRELLNTPLPKQDIRR
jgi:hypothetical protein